MSTIPDVWEDDWSQAAVDPDPSQSAEQSKKVSSKVTKAQKRAQQAEFNRQLWAEAEGPKQTNYFLESRNVVPLRQEYKAPPILLSRKGPIIQSSSRNPPPPTDGLSSLKIKDESSEDEDEVKARAQSLADRQAQAAREREEKQRKYEERRLELFGPQTATAVPPAASKSGNSSPGSGTPPHSRSATPSRGGRRGRGRGGQVVGNNQPRSQQQQQQGRDLFDANYAVKPDSVYIQRREQGSSTPRHDEVHPVRAPRGPDGTAGFNYADRTHSSEEVTPVPSAQTPQTQR